MLARSGGAAAHGRGHKPIEASPDGWGQIEAGHRGGIPAGPGPAAAAEAAVGGAHIEVLKVRDGEGEDDAAEPAESVQQMRR